MLNCPEVAELVTDYLEDRLPAGLRRRFDEHLAHCPGCTAYLDQMRQAVRAAGTIPAIDTVRVDRRLMEELLRAYRAAQDDLRRDE